VASVFECSRCNAMTYSASRTAATACERCGSANIRVLDEVNFEAAEAAPRVPSPGDHCVALVDDYEDAARISCPFIVEGLRNGERVLSWLPREVCSRIEQTLSPDELARLTVVDADEIYAPPFDPAALVDRVREMARAEDRPLRIVGGPMGSPGKVTTLAEWARYERLAHELCHDEDITGMCVWERPALDDEVLELVLRSHSLISRGDRLRRNPDFVWAGA
jgi:hypothetical protein